MLFVPTVDELREALAVQLRRIEALSPAEAKPDATLCQDSRHRTLAHLMLCQMVWLPLLRGLIERRARGVVKVHPLRLHDRMGMDAVPWATMLDQFRREREEWSSLLGQVDPVQTIMWRLRPWNAEQLTTTMLVHESKHLDALRD